MTYRKPQAEQDDPFADARATTAEVRAELESNSLAFPDWLPVVSPNYTWNWRHQLFLYKHLERVTIGECKRLLIFMPPRHTKSETVTVRYSGYRLEQNPGLRIILGANIQRLANKFSRSIRRVIKGRIELAEDVAGSAEWETNAGGGVRAFGIDGGTAGYGADLIMIDDPIKNRKQANSDKFREKMWEWYNDDIYSRLEPNGAIVLIQTRWHEDDLAGRLLKEMAGGEDGEPGEQWEVVSLPALAEENDPLGRAIGEPLCPERRSKEALEIIKRKNTFGFASLYQQRPVPLEGGLFKRDWFPHERIIDRSRVPMNLRWARGYDLAVSTKTSADFTASFRCAFDKLGNLYIAEGFRKKIEYPEQRRYVIERMLGDKNTQHGIEKALHGLALVQDLRRVQRIRNIPLRSVPVDGDKMTRALSWANLAAEGKVFLVRGDWISGFLDEVCRFTGDGDDHDDQVDAVSIAVQMLSKKSGKLHGW